MTEPRALQRSSRLSGWHTVNIDPGERLARFTVVGVAVIGSLLVTAGGSVLATVLEVLIILAGLDLVVTGALGHRPFYAQLGSTSTSGRRYVTPQDRRPWHPIGIVMIGPTDGAVRLRVSA